MPIGFPEIAAWSAEYLENTGSAPAWLAFQDAARRYRDDESWRERIDNGDAEAISALMRDVELDVASDTKVRVAANGEGTFHFVLPPDPNVVLADESLPDVVGGVAASSIGSVSTSSTFACSCFPSTTGSLGTAGTADPTRS